MSSSTKKDAPRRSGKITTFVVFGLALAASLAILFWARKGPPKEMNHPEDGSLLKHSRPILDATPNAPTPPPR